MLQSEQSDLPSPNGASEESRQLGENLSNAVHRPLVIFCLCLFRDLLEGVGVGVGTIAYREDKDRSPLARFDSAYQVAQAGCTFCILAVAKDDQGTRSSWVAMLQELISLG